MQLLHEAAARATFLDKKGAARWPDAGCSLEAFESIVIDDLPLLYLDLRDTDERIKSVSIEPVQCRGHFRWNSGILQQTSAFQLRQLRVSESELLSARAVVSFFAVLHGRDAEWSARDYEFLRHNFRCAEKSRCGDHLVVGRSDGLYPAWLFVTDAHANDDRDEKLSIAARHDRTALPRLWRPSRKEHDVAMV